MLIAIVGKSGAGKSTFTNKLVELDSNIKYLDIDKIGHYVNEIPEVKSNLIANFGKEIIKDNKVNRKALGKIVFNNPSAMQLLTNITYPYIEELIDNYLEVHKTEIVILDWLLLPKTKYLKLSNLKILITAPLAIRMQRVIERDNISKEKFLEREKASLVFNPNDYDYVIENNGNIESEVRKIYEKSIISSKF